MWFNFVSSEQDSYRCPCQDSGETALKNLIQIDANERYQNQFTDKVSMLLSYDNAFLHLGEF